MGEYPFHGTQKGDVYSFAIIMRELIYSHEDGPFQDLKMSTEGTLLFLTLNFALWFILETWENHGSYPGATCAAPAGLLKLHQLFYWHNSKSEKHSVMPGCLGGEFGYGLQCQGWSLSCAQSPQCSPSEMHHPCLQSALMPAAPTLCTSLPWPVQTYPLLSLSSGEASGCSCASLACSQGCMNMLYGTFAILLGWCRRLALAHLLVSIVLSRN